VFLGLNYYVKLTQLVNLLFNLKRVEIFMANIKVSDLQPSGYELFSDSESFLSDISDNELQISGGDIAWTDRTWHWTSLVPGSGLVVATVYTTSTQHE